MLWGQQLLLGGMLLGVSGTQVWDGAAHHREGMGIFLKMGVAPSRSVNFQNLIHTP